MPKPTRADRRRGRRHPRLHGQGAGPAAPAAGRPAGAWRLLLLAAAGIAVYANTLGHPFLFDDIDIVVQNAAIRHLGQLHTLLAAGADVPLAGHPMATFSLAINYALGGLAPFGYRAGNLLLHLASGLLLFGVIRRTLDRPSTGTWLSRRSANLALATALLWTVHPLATAAVNYFAERPALLAGCLVLGTLYAFVRSVDSTRPTLWLTAAVVACASAMATDITAAVLPILVLCYDRAFLAGSFRAALARRRAWYGMLAATWFVLARVPGLWTMPTAGGFAMPHVSAWAYFLNELPILRHYLWLVIWPHALVLDYGWASPTMLAGHAPGAAIALAVTAAVILVATRWPRFGFPGLWVVLTLAPTSSLFPWPAHAGDDARMYLPLAGLIAWVAVVAALGWHRATRQETDATSRRSSRAGFALAAVLTAGVAVALGTRTVSRNREYASPVTIARLTEARWPTPLAENMLGTALIAANQAAEAMPHLRAASRGYPPAQLNLCLELIQEHQADQAIPLLKQLIHDQPPGPWVRDARIALAQAFESTQAWPQAAEQYSKILEASPADADTHGLLATALSQQGTFADAVPHYRTYLAARPDDDRAWTGLGIALVATGKPSEAVVAFGHAEEIAPQDVSYRRNLGRAMLASGDLDRAGAQAQEAETLAPNDAAAHELMGHVLMAQGRPDDARTEFQQALALDPGNVLARDGLERLSARVGRPSK